MARENRSQECWLKYIDKTRNYFNEEIKQNKLKSKKRKKVCKILKYTEDLLILAFTVTTCVLVSALASSIDIPVGAASSVVTIKVSIITTRIKKYRPIIKKNKMKHDKIVLLTKTLLNIIEVLISKALIDSNCSHEVFVSVNIVLREYYNIKHKIENSNNKNVWYN